MTNSLNVNSNGKLLLFYTLSNKQLTFENCFNLIEINLWLRNKYFKISYGVLDQYFKVVLPTRIDIQF